jgi:hypothetical protein
MLSKNGIRLLMVLWGDHVGVMKTLNFIGFFDLKNL